LKELLFATTGLNRVCSFSWR